MSTLRKMAVDGYGSLIIMHNVSTPLACLKSLHYYTTHNSPHRLRIKV